MNSSLFHFITEKTTYGWFEDCDKVEEKDEESHAEVRTASSGEPCSGEEGFRLPEVAEEMAEEEWGMEDLETVFQTRNTSFRYCRLLKGIIQPNFLMNFLFSQNRN